MASWVNNLFYKAIFWNAMRETNVPKKVQPESEAKKKTL